jgi:hypothetical protein
MPRSHLATAPAEQGEEEDDHERSLAEEHMDRTTFSSAQRPPSGIAPTDKPNSRSDSTDADAYCAGIQAVHKASLQPYS